MTKIVDTERPTADAEKNEADVEMNLTTTDSETASVAASSAIPTRMDIFYDFNGSLGFAVGSSGFILAMYYKNWLPYFRYGSLTWIYGCIMYSIPLLQKLKGGFSQRSCPWGIGDLGEFLCYVGYTVGCVLGGFFDEQAVDRFLPAINHAFVYGSFSLALEPLYQVFLFLKRGGSCRSRMSATKLCGSSSDDDDDNKTETSLPQLKFNWDRCLELFATTFFCAAGVFGGFPPHPAFALPGVYFWEVGSLFSVARSCLMVYRRSQGLKAEAVVSNK